MQRFPWECKGSVNKCKDSWWSVFKSSASELGFTQKSEVLQVNTTVPGGSQKLCEEKIYKQRLSGF